ncbi:hypothetical protein HRG_010481 [Hirsutella rhossiliensis]|uniref:NWD NACHT-NTPase N-terminal domain-containing protein n=1 Tax=Hirsutella rhossiliensis TaxID=111463 RepID=A0A9P8MPJ8_9HYPO|nr:uncharacterized protein HRG_10481 [Hirsutella rhossiliensis]KAH0958794.1 hypothetical protein HRG_10481 [Hirsutella rhossiliensis]
MAPSWLKKAVRFPKHAVPQEPAVASSSSSTAQLTPSVPASTDPEDNAQSPGLQERLWNRAYDQVKLSDSKIVEVYEKILSNQLRQEESAPASEPTENKIGQTQETRWHQMRQLV